MTDYAKYKCPHCKVIVKRKSTKKWITSYCDVSSKEVRLQRLPDEAQ